MFSIAPAFISFIVFLSPIAPNVEGLQIGCVPVMLTGQYQSPRIYLASEASGVKRTATWVEATPEQQAQYRHAVMQCSVELGIPAPTN